MAESNPSDSDRTAAFLRLLSEHEKALSIYVTGLIGSPQDAQDILQEGKLVMWKHFHRFELGTNFVAWGRKILFHQILSHRRRDKRRPSHSQLDEEVLVVLDDEASAALLERRWTDREQALEQCITRLKPAHREILDLRYRDEASISRIAHRVGKTDGAIYRLLSRLRISLYECIEDTLTKGSVNT